MFAACKIHSPTQYKGKNNESELNFDSSFNMSANASLFFKKLSKEQKQETNNDFTPSQELIKKYGLKKIDNSYYFRGFIKTGTSFSQKSLSRINIKCSMNSGAIKTISVPINKTKEFLQIKGIEYFELSNRVHHQKQ